VGCLLCSPDLLLPPLARQRHYQEKRELSGVPNPQARESDLVNDDAGQGTPRLDQKRRSRERISGMSPRRRTWTTNNR
jgi:hypothetical protein